MKPPGSQPSAAPRPSGHCSKVGAPRAPERSFETGEGQGTCAPTNRGTSGGFARSSGNGRRVALQPRGWTCSGRAKRQHEVDARTCWHGGARRKDSRCDVAPDPRKGPGTDGAYLSSPPAMFKDSQVVTNCVVVRAKLAAGGQPWTPDHLAHICVGGRACALQLQSGLISLEPLFIHQTHSRSLHLPVVPWVGLGGRIPSSSLRCVGLGGSTAWEEGTQNCKICIQSDDCKRAGWTRVGEG